MQANATKITRDKYSPTTGIRSNALSNISVRPGPKGMSTSGAAAPFDHVTCSPRNVLTSRKTPIPLLPVRADIP